MSVKDNDDNAWMFEDIVIMPILHNDKHYHIKYTRDAMVLQRLSIFVFMGFNEEGSRASITTWPAFHSIQNFTWNKLEDLVLSPYPEDFDIVPGHQDYGQKKDQLYIKRHSKVLKQAAWHLTDKYLEKYKPKAEELTTMDHYVLASKSFVK